MFDAGFFRIESPVKSFSVFDNKNLMTECHLLDSPRPGCSNPFTQVQRKRQEHARHTSFGGDLIAFSPPTPRGCWQASVLSLSSGPLLGLPEGPHDWQLCIEGVIQENV